MARHGENIRKRADGRWEGRYRVYSEVKGRQIYRSIYGSSYEEVKAKLFGCKRELDHRNQQVKEGSRKPDPFTGGEEQSIDLANQWLMEIRDKKKRSTYVKYRFIYLAHIEPMLKESGLHTITDTFVKGHLSDSLSESTSKSVYCVLNQILKFASRKYPMRLPYLKNPLSGVKNKPIEVLTRKEQASLFVILCRETDSSKMAVLLCLYTGLRLGELCALKWSDIDFDNKLILVSRTVQRLYVEGNRTKTALLETAPKSQFSRRTIPLSASVLELLLQFRHDRDYVFGGSKPIEPRTLQNHFKRMIAQSGLEKKNFHILRHTFATNCIEGGTDVKSLSEILGHSDVQITLNRYVHPSMDTKRRHLDTLSRFYGQIYGQAE